MIESLLVVKLLKFMLVGFSGMLIDYGITWLLKEKVKLNQYIANSAGFILAASSNYIWNRLWTFASQSEQVSREYFSFIFISVIGLAINNLVILLLNGKLKLNFYLAKLIAIVVVTAWNFSMNFLITFAG
ncbi:MAG: GtrA family protein [Paludibacter sp.]|nr:GtrA family protein [Paludibacter sp.]MDD4426833.1 GtrA family protein [Paludibacter sp.]